MLLESRDGYRRSACIFTAGEGLGGNTQISSDFKVVPGASSHSRNDSECAPGSAVVQGLT